MDPESQYVDKPIPSEHVIWRQNLRKLNGASMRPRPVLARAKRRLTYSAAVTYFEFKETDEVRVILGSADRRQPLTGDALQGYEIRTDE